MPLRPRRSLSAAVPAAVLDVVVVVAFVAAGRSTHARDGGALGLLGTGWPFLVALAAGWALARGWRAPVRLWPTAVAVWLVTWIGGLGLRAAVGDGTALAFVLVAGAVLGAGLLGWRAVATAISPAGRRRRTVGSARRRQPEPGPAAPAPGGRSRSSRPG